jgi:catalase
VPDPGVIMVESSDAAEGLNRFVSALGQQRIYARETDPARV